MSALDSDGEPSDRQLALCHACCCRWIFGGTLFGLKEACEITYCTIYIYYLKVRCSATEKWLSIFDSIDNPIIHPKGPLTTWTIMSIIHPLRNLLIGVLGSKAGH